MMPQQRLDDPFSRMQVEAWTRAWLERLKKNPKVLFYWPKPYGQKNAGAYYRAALEKMSANHCSYCDGFPLGTLSAKTIDHFRPRNKFPKLVFAWGNLFLACHRCQITKSGEYRKTLLKPDKKKYRFEDYFEYSAFTGEILPNPDAPAKLKARAEETIRCLKLNAPELRSDRKRWFRIQHNLKAAGKGLERDALPYRYIFGEPIVLDWEI